MNNYQLIKHKLEAFIRKYYLNELLKGTLLFFAIGFLYFLITVSFEYFFWLNSFGRKILFWLFVGVEVALFARFILYPLAKLFKLSKGIDYEQASRIIGEHFPEVNDKLLNILQLHKNAKTTDSELLLASIDQKSLELKPVPFQIAVNFKSNLKYVKYAIIPVLIFLAIYISGNSSLFSESYTRVVNYDQAYEPPAPFSFQLNQNQLQVKENESFTLRIQTNGSIMPEDASIHYNGETYFLKKVTPGVFEYTFDRVSKNTEFYLSSNEVTSRPYQLEVINVPTLVNFEMQLDYPSYVGKKDERIKGTGNATIPEGTKVSWNLTAKSTNQIQLNLPDTIETFQQSESNFTIQEQIFRNTAYQISTSNEQLKDYERLSYQLKVVRDEYPELAIEMKRDSLDHQLMYFYGKVADDYGLTNLQLVYFPSEDPSNIKKINLKVSASTFDDFVYTFPNNLELERGKAYEFYFQVFDNDQVNGNKRTKSETFSYRKFTEDEESQEQLNNQEKTIKDMDSSLEKMKEANKELQELDQLQKEKKQLNYNDRKKLENYIQRQQQQEELMKEYSKQMKENLEKFQPEKEDDFKEQLKERLEKNEERIEQNEELLKELEKYQDKINKEELNEKIEKLSKQNQNEQKSLEQLLELTKRYYVQKKAEQVAKEMNELGKEQEKLAKNDSLNSVEEQEKMNKAFDELQKQMDDLDKENQDLKTPMDLARDNQKENSVKKDQQEASEELTKSEDQDPKESSEENDQGEQENSDQNQEKQDAQNEPQESSPSQNAKQKQKSAGEKMQEMGQQMMSMMMQGSAEQNKEDAEMLRQILDNLITFSFQQEDLMQDFKSIEENSPQYAKKLRHQYVLKENFKHVDDSLYALALRNPMIGDQITSQLTDIEFNIDKSLERLSENQARTGVASQQYVFKGANDLANMLNESLQQMQAMAMGSGQGQGKGQPSPGQGQGEGRGFQLQDIIQKQGELGEQIGQGKGKKEGESGSPGSGKSGESGEGQKSGKGNQSGKPGEQGEKGESGKGGQNGGEGNGSQQGKKGTKSSEQLSGEIYEIYKRQQELRNQLEDMIRKEGLDEKAKNLARQMKKVEDELLRSGVTERTESQMKNIQHQLLKLEEASLQQGQDNKRESETNRKNYQNPTQHQLDKAKEYFNTTEILNRQSLPLQQNYKIKVQEYFKSND
ncbi:MULTISPECIES: DUF4175 family protein [Mesonia]|uniref:Uncharacterized protein n=1 Tax=Mesonia oceanica TaxID=2687242 RepID=A0AC61Y2W3_9FLAO|nr:MULTISPECIES: DUF4175 family protein [Mesonia]MAN28550.1 hypothetical protein [Mesonia sp.]MAQ41232.1 hypothetical protein [Mesonia sp.]MBJ97330.1 hypothetical protein [Flavobacteriaceae bacterium]VVU98805.1 hypothetical protein FVB9532_00051 [Mesonia oceanica]|tara:strand:+ start:40608 stop:44150 length:3543 start_codon:yes stop_codon:yes gene_type:complete